MDLALSSGPCEAASLRPGRLRNKQHKHQALNVLVNRLPISENPVFARTLHRAVQVAVFLLVYYFVLIGGFAAGMREYKWRMVSLALLSLLWGAWFLWRVLSRADVPTTRLGYPLLVMLVASVLATFFSTDPRLSAGRLIVNMMLVISLYFTLDWMRDAWRAQLLINAMLLTGAVVCIIGFVELWQWYSGSWTSPVSWHEAGLTWSLGQSVRIKSVLHNPNALAYFLILLIGLAFCKLFHATTTWQRGMWGGYLAIVTIIVVLTQSRGGLLGALTTMVTAISLFLWSHLGDKLKLRGVRLNRRARAGVLVILTLLVVLTLTVVFPTIVQTSRNASFLSGRNFLWASTLRIFLAHPILGTGSGTFAANHLAYRSQAWTSTIYTHAHNIWLTLAAEYGIVGVVAVGYFFVKLGIIILSYLHHTQPKQWSWALVGGVSILAGQGVHNLVDDFMEFPSFTWFTILAVTLCLIPILSQYPPISLQKRRVWLLLVGSGILFIVGGSLWYGRAFAAYDKARLAAQTGAWPQAVRWLEKAVGLDPAYYFYRQQLALAYGHLGRDDDRYLALALAQQEQVYKQSNSYPPDAAYLACLYWHLGQAERAVELMRFSASIAPIHTGAFYSYHLSRPTFFFNLGHYYESMGETDLAQEAYAQVLLAFPQVGTSPYWHVSEGRRQNLRASASIAQQLTDDKNLLAEIAFYSGDYQTALGLFAAPPIDQIGRAKSLLGLGQLESAGMLLATESLQGSARSLPYHAQVLMVRGDLVQAETEIQKAIALSHQDSSMILNEPSYYYLWGSLAEIQGNMSLAEENYKWAIAASTAIQTAYANLVWNRQPMPTEQPFCLLIPYPADSLSQPSIALASLMMAQNDPSGAAEVYINLLQHEPYNLEAQRRLKELSTTYPTFRRRYPTDPIQ